jgi:TetR/AcrR family transcriptional regulator, mexCD-oprJ operon repressor
VIVDPVETSATAPHTGPAHPDELRADARRNRQAVLDAALRLYRTDPAATVAQVAREAGVGRVTLYGHFPTREALVGAALTEAVGRASRALATVEPDEDPVAALPALLAAAWPALADGHGAIDAACRVLPPDEVAERHEPVVAPLRDLLARGRRTAAFRDDLTLAWLVAGVSALVHAAAEQVAAGVLDHDEATRSLTESALALVLPR